MQTVCPRCGGPSGGAGAPCAACLARMVENPTDLPRGEPPLAAGQKFRNLEIVDLLARGGMGVVYTARQDPLNRKVALKILPRGLAEENDFRPRFQREAHALAALSHANIVALYDFGIEGDLTFLVMEFVEGATLRKLLRDNTLEPRRALEIASQVADALDYAHQLGVVHRDVKPENILIDPRGAVKITDFGLAKILGSEAARLTESNLVIGTPHYMAPEQLERPREVDHRADLYSLGVVLYEMLTAELPIGRFEPPSRKNPAADTRADAIVLKALAKDPASRYARAGELRAELARVLGTPEPARVQSTPRGRSVRNVEVQCACGWVFFIPGNARGFVNCPTCRAPVPAVQAPGRTAGTARRPVPVAPPPPPPPAVPAGLKLLVAGALGVFALLVAVLVVVMVRWNRHDEPKEKPSAERPRPPSAAPAAPARVRPPPPAPVPPAPPNDFIDYDRRLEHAVSRCNMAGVVSTVLLHTGRRQEHDDLHERLKEYEAEQAEILAKIAERGERRSAPARFQAGDRLTGLGDRHFRTDQPPQAFADLLREWLGKFRAGARETAIVMRGAEPVSFAMHFQERHKELIVLANLTGVILGEANRVESPAPPAAAPAVFQPPAAPPSAPLPAPLLSEVREKLAALPPYYRGTLPAEEQARLQKVLETGKGFPEDADFLKTRVLAELCARALSEVAGFQAKVAELEARLADAPASTDVVHFKDGRKIEGVVEEETDEHLRVKSRFGSARIPRAEVQRVERGKGAATEFRARYQAARGKRDDLAALLSWCKERNLPAHRELVANALLLADPGHERARLEEGFVRSPSGSWSREAEVRLAEGKIEWNGRWHTPDQFRAVLVSSGYVQLNGLWCEKAPKVFRIDNLYRDEGKFTLLSGGGSLQSKMHTENDTVYDVRSRVWVPRARQVATARYIGGGTCHLEIRAEGDIAECRVRARAQVPRVGDSVAVSVVNEVNDLFPKPLYTLSAPGENTSTYDVSDKVRGRNRFLLRVTTGGSGMFLPSDSNDLGVLEVRYSVGKPMERVNAALGLRREAPPAPIVAAGGLPLPADPNQQNDFVEMSVKSIAGNFSAQSDVVEVLLEVRRLTQALSYTRDYAIPPRFTAFATTIRDPLQVRWDEQPREFLVNLGSWWAATTAEDRREFVTFYGLWCARTRHLGRGGR